MWILTSLLFLSLQSASDQPALGWQPVPLVTAALRAAGFAGGEGGQWPRALAIDSTGNHVLLGIDVGGMYISRDAGRSWAPTNVGFTPRGCVAAAFDPHNSARILAVGANSSPHDRNGLYLSTDGGGSWKSVLPVSMGGLEEFREGLAYDPHSLDAAGGFSRTAFWSRADQDKPSWGTADVKSILYRTDDGGETWREVPGTEAVGGSILRVDPTTRGRVYAGNRRGFYVSTDGARTFRRRLEGEVTGMDVSPNAPNCVWVSFADRIQVSKDGGESFQPVNTSGVAQSGYTIRHLKVSPVDRQRMVCWTQQNDGWNWPRFTTEDGGRTWTQGTVDATGAFLPQNSRQGISVWHPKQATVAFSLGGDWATKSTDGGKTWRWSNAGNNAVLVGGRFAWSLHAPETLFFGSQDYNGAVTHDRGHTWTYLNPAGNGWGGFTYGGYALSKSVLVVGNAAGWGDPRFLRVSRDGGQTWTDTGLKWSGPDVSYGDPTDPKIGFASNYRTTDLGLSWKPMVGCDGVFTHAGRALYGVKRSPNTHALVRSTDSGASWQVVATLPKEIEDIAVDSRGNRIYVASDLEALVWDGRTWTTLDLPRDSVGLRRVRGVAVDPVDPRVVYVASAANVYSSSTAVLRSTDAGRTWVNLTLNSAPAKGQKDGGREAFCIRVHPRTREAFVATSCYGIWKIAGPAR